MLPITFALLAYQVNLPPAPSFDYSGTPSFAGVDASNLLIRGHSAIVEVGSREVRVSTTTEVKNRSNRAITVRLVVPRRREGDENSGQPTFAVSATLGQAFVNLRPVSTRGSQRELGPKHVHYESDLQAPVTLQPGATYGLRTSYSVALGHAAADGKTKVTGYALEGDASIGQFNLSYKTSRGEVFRLPEAHPSLDWEIGTTGAFTKKTDFVPGHRLSWISFYAGGFD